MPNPEKTTPPPQKRVLPAADDVEALTGDFDKLDVETGRGWESSPVVATQDIDVGDGESPTRRRRAPQTPTVGQRPECGARTPSTSSLAGTALLSWYCYNRMGSPSTSGPALVSSRSAFWARAKKSWSIGKAEGLCFPARSCFPLSRRRVAAAAGTRRTTSCRPSFACGFTPTPAEIDSLEHDYKGMKAYLRRLQPRQASDLHRVLRGVPSDCVDLLDKMLTFLPEDRLSLDEALQHPYLQGLPEGKLERDGSSGFLEPSETAVGPAMSRIEDDDAWERVAQHRADRDMSNVLWRLVERFPSELAPRGGLLGHEELAQVPAAAVQPRRQKSAASKELLRRCGGCCRRGPARLLFR